MNSNLRNGIVTISLFIILLSPILQVHAPGVSAQYPNNTPLSVSKETYALGETVCITLTAAQEDIVFLNIISPEGICYAALPSTDREYQFNPEIAGSYVINVLLRAGGTETFLTTGFVVADPEIVFGEPEQGEIVLGEHVNWSQHISITNHERFSISNFPVSIPLPLKYSNLSSGAGFTIIDSSIPVDLAAGEDASFDISYQTPPVQLAVTEERIVISDLIPPDAFDIRIYREMSTNEEGPGLTDEMTVKQVTVWHNSSIQYHDIPVAIESRGFGEIVEFVDDAGIVAEMTTERSNETLSWTIPELSEMTYTVFKVTREQGDAEIGEPVEWQLNAYGTIVRYKMPAPYKNETEPVIADGTWKKEIVIGSNASVHYSDVTAYSTLEEIEKSNLRLFWVVNGLRIDVTGSEEFDVSFSDTNNNGILDKVVWNVPMLSNQSFEVEADITVINVQSYPPVGGNWGVEFRTVGCANLTITAVDGTTWSDTNGDNDLKFLEIACGDKTADYEWVNNSVFIENYSCNETGYEISKVLTAGSHHLKFQFGSDVEYAHNWATDLSNWSYGQSFSISNTAENLSYYQVKIELNSSNVDSNWNWSNNGNDTRFTYYNSSTETETEIPFWMESWNSTANTSTIWVNVTSVANNTGTTIYMYYGNSNASSASNGTNAFEFFDDFDNIDNWEEVLFYARGTDHANISAADGKLRIVSTGGNRAGACTKINQLSQGQRFESKVVTRLGDANLVQMLYHGSQSNLYENIVYNGGDYDVFKAVSGSVSHIYHRSEEGVEVTCYPYVEYRTNDYLHFGARSCGEKVNDNSPWDNTNFKLAFYCYYAGTMDIDWAFVRKYASPEPSVSPGGTVISTYTPAKQLQIQDERGASYKQSYPYLQKSRTLNASATLSSTDGVGGVRFIVDQGKAGETTVDDTNTSDTLFSTQFSSLCYGNHTLDITILDASLNPLSGAGQTESIDPFWIVPYIIQFVGDSITISLADDTTCDVLNLADATSSCNAVTSENSLELPCWDNDTYTPNRGYSNGIHIFYSDYAKSIYGTYVFGNNEAQSGITAEGTHTKFQSNTNGYADRFTSLDENSINANLFGPTHAYVMLGLNDKHTGVSEAYYETQLSNVVNDTHNQGIPYEHITILYPTYSINYDVLDYLDNIDNVVSNLGTLLINDLYNETKDNYNGDKSWYSTDNLHFTRAGSRNISRIIAEQSAWLTTGQATYTEFSGSETTDFNNLLDITNVSDATLHVANTAKITWYNNVNASGANFDTNVDFGFAFVDVNAPGLNSTFNSSANVTLYNLSWSETPVIFEDGSPCPDCTFNFYSGGNLSFDVTHFTNYSAGANANLTIWDDTDPEGGSQTKLIDEQIKFHTNYTNKTTGQSINGTGVYCNISFDVAPNGPFGMTFNSTSLLYEYNRSFSSSGTSNWNVTGNGSALGYEELNVTDTVTVSIISNAPEVTLNNPDHGSITLNNWTVLNATVIDVDDDPMTVYFYANNNNSNGLNASDGLVYIGEDVANGTTLTYNLTALPIKPSEDELVLLMHFDNRSKFDEDSTHVYDFSGNRNNGTVNGNPSYNISGGKFAGAFGFDGTGDYVDCGNDPGLPENTPFTVSAWVKLNTLNQEWRIITDKFQDERYVTLSLYKADNATFSFTTGNGAWANLHTGNIVAHQWYHVVAVWDGTTKFIYLNGSLAASTDPDATKEPCSGAGNFTIGGRGNTGAACIDGTIDEVAIYNRSLSADEILNHYHLGVEKYYWKVNASDGVLSNESDVGEFTIGTDQTAPSIQLNYPDDKANLNSSAVNFNWTATDSIDDVLLCNLTIDGVVNQSNINATSGQPTNYSVSGISTGVHNWSVTCRDDASNVNTSETRTFGVNNSAPNVTLNSPPNGSSTHNSWEILNATVTDADDDPMTVYFYANNNSNGLNDSEGLVHIRENIANGTTLTYNLTALPIKPSEDELVLLMHFDNRSEFCEHTRRNVANAVYDFSGNGNNGTLGNANAGTAPTWNVTGGKFAGAFLFDGTDDYITVSDDPSLRITGPLTVEAWVNFDSLGDYGNYTGLVSKWDIHADGFGYGIFKEINSDRLSFHLSNGSNNVWIESDNIPSVDTWYHVVGNFDGSVMLMYVNGVLQSNTSNEIFSIVSNTNPVTIGSFEVNNRDSWFNGTIDEVAIYNRSLSASEILYHYRLGEGKYNWKVNATDGVSSNESDVREFLVVRPDLRVVNVTFDYWDTSENRSSVSETGIGYHVKENKNITINVTIANYGSGNVTSDFDVSFFDSAGVYGNWSRCFLNSTYNVAEKGQIGNTNTGYPYNTTYVIGYWNPSLVGTHNISVWADPANSASESAANTTNNNASAVINVSAWQKYWGNVTGSIALADSAASSLYGWTWSNETDVGYAYIVKDGASINWSALHALGCDSDDTLNASGQDFLDADTNLAMVVGSNNVTGFENNNITELFSGGDPSNATNTTSFTVYGNLISNVSIVNSIDMTNHTSIGSANFVTGILWDATSDNNGYYDTTDDEILVFVTKIRAAATGLGSTAHNYEFAAPCALNPVIGGDLDIYMELK